MLKARPVLHGGFRQLVFWGCRSPDEERQQYAWYRDRSSLDGLWVWCRTLSLMPWLTFSTLGRGWVYLVWLLDYQKDGPCVIRYVLISSSLPPRHLVNCIPSSSLVGSYDQFYTWVVFRSQKLRSELFHDDVRPSRILFLPSVTTSNVSSVGY